MNKYFSFFIISLIFSCNTPTQETTSIAANEEVAEYMKAFEGRGDQADSTLPTPTKQALEQFEYPNDLQLDLIAAEPLIVQPLSINFDHRGRLWVVQYGQYPFPKGLKVVSYDYHLRAQFDRMPDPPPEGIQGADKITVLEDMDGDGTYDKATDALEGLNIATSLTWGRGRIWVLNPPFLLAYPDPDGDGFPDGKPVVHLTGFGLEDTHAVANSLRWGPDGWLYGAQGSTTTATISSSVTKNVHFKGQAIWRYHPETEIFEIYAEGGGNTFFVEIDEKGRIYSGHNGGEARGQHYKQGAYYVKNWGKHGALTNPYAFGFFPHMKLKGEKLRFTHGFIKYEGNQLPERYQHALIGINPLHNFLQVSTFERDGSTFKNTDTERILSTDDHWFRPVDIHTGPDGGVYIADWYDGRLSHIDPRDTWHKTSGRIYRLAGKRVEKLAPFDLSTYSSLQLVNLLSYSNKWYRQQALRLLGDRKDTSILPKLIMMVRSSQPQTALEALWAIHLTGGFDDDIASEALDHDDPHVRRWAVRLIGDKRTVSAPIASQLADMANTEPDPEVRSQLAASAKRLPGKVAIPIIKSLLTHFEDIKDPHIPLQIWWALEGKSIRNKTSILKLLEESEIWKSPVIQEVILSRLMQRYTMEAGGESWLAAARLLDLSPDSASTSQLLEGFWEGMRGKDLDILPKELLAAIEKYGNGENNARIALSIKQGDTTAIHQSLEMLHDPQVSLSNKLSIVEILGESTPENALQELLEIPANIQHPVALRQAVLEALSSYSQDEVGEKVTDWYPDRLRADPEVKLAALQLLVTRSSWAKYLIEAISVSRRIAPEDVPHPLIRQLLLLDDREIERSVYRIWPQTQLVNTEEKLVQVKQIKTILAKNQGSIDSGKKVFHSLCGACHKLNDQGGIIGPDLTGYDRSNLNYLLLNTIDPNAEIREGYVNYVVKTQDGKTFTGILTDNTSESITIKAFSGKETLIPSGKITHMEAQPVSLMPERLLSALSEQELQDLFAYLQS